MFCGERPLHKVPYEVNHGGEQRTEGSAGSAGSEGIDGGFAASARPCMYARLLLTHRIIATAGSFPASSPTATVLPDLCGIAVCG